MRDPALDLLRSVALARVVLWHAFAAAWMTFFAAMPLLFFVAGVLLAASSDNQSPRTVLWRRCRRLLPPLWVYGTAVAVAGAVRSGSAPLLEGPSLDALRVAVSWIVPVTDPIGSTWHGGWLSTHLWYLRAYLWLLLLAPVLAVLARRLRVSLPVLAFGIVALDVAAHRPLSVIGTGPSHALIGDILTYGTFAVLGMAYHRRRWSPKPGVLLAGAGAAAAATAVYAAAVGLPGGGINGSYPAVAFTGAAWLLAVGAFEQPIRGLAERPGVRRITAGVNRRAVTIYLWHPAAIAAAYVVVSEWPLTGGAGPAVVLVAGLLIVLAVAGVGWVEDVAARRPVRGPAGGPSRRAPAVGAALAAVVVVLGLVSAPIFPDPAQASGPRRTRLSHVPPPPSFRPALSDAAFPRSGAPLVATARLRHRLPARALQEALEKWMAGQTGFDSIAVGLTVDGRTWTGDARRPEAASVARAGDVYGIASVTKTFTAALVLRESRRGRIHLDRAVPALEAVGPLPPGVRITPRHLLQHTSGLVDYPLAAGYDPEETLTPADAVRLSLRTPLRSAPGGEVHYANSNYHWLGLLLERITGRPYADLVGDLTRGLGLSQTRVESTAGPGWTGFASGGVHSTVSELARWGDALFTPGEVLDRAAHSQLTTLDEHNLTAGAWPLCPCSTDQRGQKRATALGQGSGHGGLYHFGEGFSLAVHMEPPALAIDAKVEALGRALLQVLRAGPAR